MENEASTCFGLLQEPTNKFVIRNLHILAFTLRIMKKRHHENNMAKGIFSQFSENITQITPFSSSILIIDFHERYCL